MKFLRYIAVQVVAYGLDMGGFLVALTLFGSGPVIANFFGKVAAGFFAFLAHRYFTFGVTQRGERGRQAAMYFGLLALNIPLSSAALSFVLLFVSYPIIAKLISDAICVFLTYWLSNKYVFARSRKDSVELISRRSGSS